MSGSPVSPVEDVLNVVSDVLDGILRFIACEVLGMPQDTDRDELFQYACWISYATVAALLLIYFLWDDSPLHTSLTMERFYVRGVLTVLFCVVVINALMAEHMHTVLYDSNIQAELGILLLLVTLILYHVSHCYLTTGLFEPFYDCAVGARRAAKSRTPQPTPRAKRTAQELSELVEELLLSRGRLHNCLSEEGILLIALLCLAMVMVLMVDNDPHWRVCGVVYFVEFCFVIYGICHKIRGFFLWRSKVKAVHSLVSGLIGNRMSLDKPAWKTERKRDLHYVLATISVATLLEVGSRQTFRYLTERALEFGLLDTTMKAIMVDALAKKGLSYNYVCQEAVWRLILTCEGAELTDLKNLIDGSGNYRNLHKMIYKDMTNNKIRTDTLRHLRGQANRLRDELGGAVGIKILSDVDDTLSCSGGSFPAGCDTKYPKKAVYPGCLAFYRALDCRSTASNAPSCNLVFLSARPHLYKDLMEDKSYKLFSSLYEDERLHCFPTLLPGDLFRGLTAMLTYACRKTGAWRQVGEKKFATYREFACLYAEYDFVFCGDNGQGDLFAGQLMANKQVEEDGEHERDWSRSDYSDDSDEQGLHLRRPQVQSSRLLAVVIHEVMPAEECLAFEHPTVRGEKWFRDLRERRILFHRTYLGAAVALHSLDPELITAAQVAEIAISAMDDFDEARMKYPEWVEESRFEALQELNEDLAKAQAVLKAAGLNPLPELRSNSQLDQIARPHAGYSVEDLCDTPSEYSLSDVD